MRLTTKGFCGRTFLCVFVFSAITGTNAGSLATETSAITGTSVTDTIETTVTIACASDADCKGAVCINSGAANAECVAPACANDTVCDAINYGDVCRNPGQADAVCVTPACPDDAACDAVTAGDRCLYPNLENAVCVCGVQGGAGNGSEQGSCDAHQMCQDSGECTSFGGAYDFRTEQLDPNDKINVTLGQPADFTFVLPSGTNYLSCLIFRPDETYNISQGFKNNSLTHSTSNPNDTISSVEDGRLRLEHLARLAVPDSQIYEFSCTVRIDRANKSDNGEWRAIIRSGDQIHTYYEYSQVVTVLVNGGWRVPPGECPCGQDRKQTHLSCTDPERMNGGNLCNCSAPELVNKTIIGQCDGQQVTIEEDCVNEPCPVPGGWRESTGDCPCGQGQKEIHMSCTDPEPAFGGAKCDCNVASFANLEKTRECDGYNVTVLEDCDNEPCQDTMTTAVTGKTDKGTEAGSTWWVILVVLALCLLLIIGVMWYVRRRRDATPGMDKEAQQYKEVPMNDYTQDPMTQETNNPIIKNQEPVNTENPPKPVEQQTEA